MFFQLLKANIYLSVDMRTIIWHEKYEHTLKCTWNVKHLKGFLSINLSSQNSHDWKIRNWNWNCHMIDEVNGPGRLTRSAFNLYSLYKCDSINSKVTMTEFAKIRLQKSRVIKSYKQKDLYFWVFCFCMIQMEEQNSMEPYYNAIDCKVCD